MSIVSLIVLMAFGMLLLALEVVVLPGGICGIIGIICSAIGVYFTYAQYGLHSGNVALVSCLLCCAIFLVVLLKTKTWKKASIENVIDSKVNQVEENQGIHVGDRGETIARLAPTGKALINGQQVEVHSVNQFIDPGKPIEVIAIEGYRVDVKEL